MTQGSRLTGIDLFRGIGIIAVVILHANQGLVAVPSSWNRIINFASFAVPFFLATSFYLAAQKLYSSKKPYDLKSRTLRLLIPYIFWSLFYLFYKISKSLITGDVIRMYGLLQDPSALIFCGGASFHLYFLPLLLTGTLTIKAFENLIKERKIRFHILLPSFLISLIFYEAALTSGNEFNPGLNTAFQPFISSIFSSYEQNLVVKTVSFELAWIFRCLPYTLLAVTLAHPLVNERLSKQIQKPEATVILLTTFLIVNSLSSFFPLHSLHELSRGYIALLSALSLSNWLNKNNSLIKNLSTCSFGIYLAHVVPIEFFQIIENRSGTNFISRTTTLNLLIFSVIVLLTTWIVVYFFTKSKFLSKLMFGT